MVPSETGESCLDPKSVELEKGQEESSKCTTINGYIARITWWER